MEQSSNEQSANQSNNSIFKKKGTRALIIIGFVTISTLASNFGDIVEFFEGHFGSKEKVEISDAPKQDPPKQDPPEQTATEDKEPGGQPEVEKKEVKAKVNYFQPGVPEQVDDLKEIVFFVGSDQSGLDPLDIESALESSFQNMGYETVYPFNSNLTRSKISSFVKVKSTTLTGLSKFTDFQAFCSGNISYSKDSRGRDVCKVSLNLTVSNVATGRRVKSWRESFNGNGQTKDDAYQNSLKQIERYDFFK